MNLKIYYIYSTQSRQVLLGKHKLQLLFKAIRSISKQFQEFIIQIGLELVLVNWRALLCWVAVSSVYHNLNFAELFVTSVLHLFVFRPLVPFIILAIKFVHFLFLHLFGFSLWIHHGLDFRVNESFVFNVGKDRVFSGFLSEALGCLWSWENFPASLLTLRSDPSSPACWVGNGLVEVRLGQLHELTLRLFHGIFLWWEQCLRGRVKIVWIVQVLQGSSLFGLESHSAWVLFGLIHVGDCDRKKFPIIKKKNFMEFLMANQK